MLACASPFFRGCCPELRRQIRGEQAATEYHSPARRFGLTASRPGCCSENGLPAPGRASGGRSQRERRLRRFHPIEYPTAEPAAKAIARGLGERRQADESGPCRLRPGKFHFAEMTCRDTILVVWGSPVANRRCGIRAAAPRHEPLCVGWSHASKDTRQKAGTEQSYGNDFAGGKEAKRYWTRIEPRLDCHFDCHSLLSLLE
jgi:hypothetical protein